MSNSLSFLAFKIKTNFFIWDGWGDDSKFVSVGNYKETFFLYLKLIKNLSCYTSNRLEW